MRVPSFLRTFIYFGLRNLKLILLGLKMMRLLLPVFYRNLERLEFSLIRFFLRGVRCPVKYRPCRGSVSIASIELGVSYEP